MASAHDYHDRSAPELVLQCCGVQSKVIRSPDITRHTIQLTYFVQIDLAVLR